MKIKTIVTFTLGAAVGSVASYLFFRKKFIEQLEEELYETRQYYLARLEKLEEKNTPDAEETTIDESSLVGEGSAKGFTKVDVPKTDYTRFYGNEKDPTSEHPDESAYLDDEEVGNSFIYEIGIGEMGMEGQHEMLEVTYFTKDDSYRVTDFGFDEYASLDDSALIDEGNQIIEDIDPIVEASGFKHSTREEMAVRNLNRGEDYRVIKKYSSSLEEDM